MSILNEEIIKPFINISGLVYIVLDLEGKIVLVNNFACEVLKYVESELLGQNWFDKCVPEEKVSEIKGVHEKVIAGEGVTTEYFENEILTKTGEKRLISWHNAVYMGQDGKVLGSISAGEDVTDKKKIEEELRERIEELDKVNKLMVGRELKMTKLKEELSKQN